GQDDPAVRIDDGDVRRLFDRAACSRVLHAGEVNKIHGPLVRRKKEGLTVGKQRSARKEESKEESKEEEPGRLHIRSRVLDKPAAFENERDDHDGRRHDPDPTRRETLGNRTRTSHGDGRTGESGRDNPAVPQYYNADPIGACPMELPSLGIIAKERQVEIEG